MERSCQVQLTAKAAGRPLLIDHRLAVATREQLGGDLVAWINYQPLWQDISRSEPDLLLGLLVRPCRCRPGPQKPRSTAALVIANSSSVSTPSRCSSPNSRSRRRSTS